MGNCGLLRWTTLDLSSFVGTMPPVRRKRGHNFDGDGHIKIQLRTGKERADTYFKRSKTLVKNGKQIHQLTKAHVRVNVIPVWEGGKEHHYVSEGFPIDTPKKTIPQSSFPGISPKTPTRRSPRGSVCVAQLETPTRESPRGKRQLFQSESSTGPRPLKSPSSRPRPTSSKANSATAHPVKETLARPRVQRPDTNKCRICSAEYMSAADEEIDSLWVQCSRKGCSFWVHCVCSGIFYKSTKAGRKALEKWAENHFFCSKHMPKNS